MEGAWRAAKGAATKELSRMQLVVKQRLSPEGSDPLWDPVLTFCAGISLHGYLSGSDEGLLHGEFRGGESVRS